MEPDYLGEYPVMIHRVIDIWKDYDYEGELGDGFRPRLHTYLLDGENYRPGVVICPGGGYGGTSAREGEPVALRFAAAGFHAFVLHYSVAPRRFPLALLDLSRSLAIIRENREAWRVQDGKAAICGFSAGGHLAAGLGVHWHRSYLSGRQAIPPGSNRPDGLVLCYPVISTGEFRHKGSFRNLLGEDPSPEDLEHLSLEHHVSEKTPPAFLWHTGGDRGVPLENSILFAQALRKQGIPFDLHIYQHGPHGLSLANEETDPGNLGSFPRVQGWIDLSISWLNRVL